MDRVRRISLQILSEYESLFTDDFEKNKSILTKIAIVRSKQLRNKLAGYITTLIKEKKLETS